MKTEKKSRGVFEKIPGSGIWWIRYIDAKGALRREKAGSKSAAETLRHNRKAEAWEGKKLPKLRTRVVRFAELAADYLEYATANNEGHAVDEYRINKLKAAFGDQPAELPIADLRKWFAQQKWQKSTQNRCRTVLGLIYKLAIENKKAESNPARLLKHHKEPDGVVRYLNQYSPDEESRLRKLIMKKYPQHMPEFEIALNTGLRRKEQYERISWSGVDFLRCDLFVPPSKNGYSRYISLNAAALASFQELFARHRGEGPIFAAERGGDRLQGDRHWFEDAIAQAKIPEFTWHSLRHTFASRLVMAGVDLRTVAELMGHRKIQMTMRYAHLAPAHTMAAVDKLAAYNAMEKARQAEPPADILISGPGERTDTITDTGVETDSGMASANVQ